MRGTYHIGRVIRYQREGILPKRIRTHVDLSDLPGFLLKLDVMETNTEAQKVEVWLRKSSEESDQFVKEGMSVEAHDGPSLEVVSLQVTHVSESISELALI